MFIYSTTNLIILCLSQENKPPAENKVDVIDDESSDVKTVKIVKKVKTLQNNLIFINLKKYVN